MKRALILASLLIFGIQMNATAAETQSSRISDDFYVGAGLSSNSLTGFDDATGFQIFGGYILPFRVGGATHSVEVGYMDSGDFEETILFLGIPFEIDESAEGLWGTYTFNKPLADNVNLIARGGFDIGDDDGLMLGIGFEFDFDAPIKLRTEFVQRDNVDSLQLNVVYAL